MKLIGLITTVVVLGAVYLFIVKPVLDTTNNAFDSVNESIDKAVDSGDFHTFTQQVQDSDLSQDKTDRLFKCIDRVKPDTTKMQACVDKYGP